MANRIDKELFVRGMVKSRAKAQEIVELGFVSCNGKVVNKSNFLVEESDKLEIKENNALKYVSRGGLKLEKAITEFGLDFQGLNVLDIGSSTGGFCDCALKHGAKHILAVDVGTNLLDKTLREDKRIDLHEQTNFKDLPSCYFQNLDIAVCDVSFISLKQILKKLFDEKINIDIVCLIKPQFECGKEIASKYKGVILDKNIHRKIIKDLFEYFESLKFSVLGLTVSPITGGDGNIEYLTLLSNKHAKSKQFDIEKITDTAFETHKN